MPHYILRFETKAGPRYLEWSTIVDAPVTYGLPLAEFTKYWRKEYGIAADRGDRLTGRIADADRKGTDCPDAKSADEVIADNRAGSGETVLTKEQIIDYYCVRRGKGKRPKGTPSTMFTYG